MGLTRAMAVWMAGSAFLLAATTVAGAQGPRWTGLYMGATVGSGWGESRFNDGVTSNPFDIDGTVAGVTIGYGFKVDKSWIAGIEADLSSGLSGSFGPGNLGTPNGGLWLCNSGPCSTDVDWFATVRARLGYTLNSALLVYGTAGFAFGAVDSGIAGDTSYQVRHTNAGWTAGGGIEYGFAPSWSMKLEYLHVDLGWTDRPASLKSDAEFDVVRVGVNFYFGK